MLRRHRNKPRVWWAQSGARAGESSESSPPYTTCTRFCMKTRMVSILLCNFSLQEKIKKANQVLRFSRWDFEMLIIVVDSIAAWLTYYYISKGLVCFFVWTINIVRKDLGIFEACGCVVTRWTNKKVFFCCWYFRRKNLRALENVTFILSCFRSLWGFFCTLENVWCRCERMVHRSFFCFAWNVRF